MNTRSTTMGKASPISSDELEAANLHFATFADANEEHATKWRLDNYTIWRTGWNSVARRYQENCVHSHEEAIALVDKLCPCLHNWKNTRRHDDTNPILGTYTRGNYRACTKCGKEDLVITSRNNWSGD